MEQDRKFAEMKDCRLCTHFSREFDVEVVSLYCSKTYFHHVDRGSGLPTVGDSPEFQCNGEDYVFNPNGEWAHIYDRQEK